MFFFLSLLSFVEISSRCLILVHVIVNQAAGVEFPPREENTVPIFTPPQTHPVTAVHHPSISAFEDDAAIQASLQSDASGLRYLLLDIISLWPL